MRSMKLMSLVAVFTLPAVALVGCVEGSATRDEDDQSDDTMDAPRRGSEHDHAARTIRTSALQQSLRSDGELPEQPPFQVEVPSNDTCATAEQHGVQPGTSFSLRGTTEGASDDYQTFCADDVAGISHADVVYAFNVVTECVLSVVVTPADPEGGFDGVISYRSDCEEDFVCVDATSTGSEKLTGVVPGDTIQYIIVSNAGAAGAFDLDVVCDPIVCGDGMLSSTEECDDGGVADGDGCSASCQLEAADSSIDTCSGAANGPAIVITANESLQIPAPLAEIRSTVNATDSGTGSCMIASDTKSGFFGSADHVYRVTPNANGSLTVRLGNDADGVPFCGEERDVEPDYPYVAGCYDRAIHVRQASCDDALAEIACADSQVSWWSTEELTFTAMAGTDYYVFVDGWLNFGEGVESYDVGNYVLELELN